MAAQNVVYKEELLKGDFHFKKISIERGIKKFGNKYDYSEVNIINVDSDVLIGCLIHGVIPMTPYRHLKSETGCKQCGEIIRGLNSRLPKNDFINKAPMSVGNKNDYSQIEYEGISKNST